jgi:single-stranded DNA-binding protein
MRTITVTGHIVADAEKKLSKGGKEYITFRIANNEFNDEKGQDGKQKPYWIGVTSLNQRHFSMVQYLTKGKPVIIVGDYSDRIYQNREGNCDISRDILANAIYFLPGSGENGGNGNTAPKTAESAPTTQTVMQKPKPTTEELKVPTQDGVKDDEADDLPF